jgi:RIO-like serine/threonine protein kinase
MSRRCPPPLPAILGSVQVLAGGRVACRDTADARWWARPVARWLARREARALQQLAGLDGIPRLLDWDGHRLLRTCIAGRTMHESPPRDAAYFREAHRLLRAMHRRGVAHNDLAREPNWLVTPAGAPAVIDFQLAWCDRRRGRLFRLMAREDLRHLLKHKRHYCPQRLTARERRLLAAPTRAARLWRVTLHPFGRVARHLLPRRD